MHLPLYVRQRLSPMHQFLFWETLNLKLMFCVFSQSAESSPWWPRDDKNLFFSIRTISFKVLWWSVLSITQHLGTLLSFNDSKMWIELAALQAGWHCELKLILEAVGRYLSKNLSLNLVHFIQNGLILSWFTLCHTHLQLHSEDFFIPRSKYRWYSKYFKC